MYWKPHLAVMTGTGPKARHSMIKIWGRNTSSNVQKVMWAVGEIGLPHQRIDVGGAVRQEQRSGLSGDEPERPGADAGGGGRLPALGIQFGRALSRRQASLQRVGAGRSCAGRRTPASGWIGSFPSPARRSSTASGASSARRRRSAIMRPSRRRRKKTTEAMQILDASSPRPRMWRAMRSPTATFRSASSPTAFASSCPTGRR